MSASKLCNFSNRLESFLILKSIEKNINNILLSFYLENELENPFSYQQANINLKSIF